MTEGSLTDGDELKQQELTKPNGMKPDHLALLIAIGCFAMAAWNAFVMDDAFISFRYARNLIETGELTWNPGETPRVEGYTNFLWTMLLAGGLALGVGPITTSIVLGLLAFAGSLLMTYKLALELLGSQRQATVAMGLLGSNYTFNCYATGGLETQLQVLLLTTSCWIAKRISDGTTSIKGFALFSALTAASLMTRLDSALPLGLLFAWAWLSWLQTRPRPGQVAAAVAASAAPTLLTIGPWLLWKLSYYGDIYPNTYYLKVLPVTLDLIAHGLGYCFNFIYSYQLLPVVVLALFKAKALLRPDLLACTVVVLSWFTYVTRIGGGFMEFRMLVPVMPLLFILMTVVIFELPKRPRIVLIAFVLFGSAFHAVNFRQSGEVETITALRDHVKTDPENWETIGKALYELFPEQENPVTISLGAAGAIPYYSRLPTIDTMGLNDIWVARNGPIRGLRPGHSKKADYSYLLRRQVNLAFRHPMLSPLGDHPLDDETRADLRLEDYAWVDVRPFPISARLLEIPITETHGVRVIYLVKHPLVEAAIKRHSLKTWPLR